MTTNCRPTCLTSIILVGLFFKCPDSIHCSLCHPSRQPYISCRALCRICSCLCLGSTVLSLFCLFIFTIRCAHTNTHNSLAPLPRPIHGLCSSGQPLFRPEQSSHRSARARLPSSRPKCLRQGRCARLGGGGELAAAFCSTNRRGGDEASLPPCMSEMSAVGSNIDC